MVTVKLAIVVTVRTAVPVAAPSENKTLGTLVYPVPLGDTDILPIGVGVRSTVPAAPGPPPPLNATVGALV